MKLNVKALAMTCATLWGLAMFLMTLWVIVLGDGTNVLLESLRSFYMGYDISYKGSFVGLVYGFIDGFISGGLFGWVYNRLA